MSAMALSGDRRRPVYAAVAVGLAIGLHVGLAWWIGRQPPAPATARAAGVGGMLVDLGPSGAAAGAARPATVPEAAEVPPDVVEAVEAVKPAETAVPAEPVEALPPEPVEAVAPAPAPEAVDVVPVETTEPVETVEPVDAVQPQPVETVEPPPPAPPRKPPPPARPAPPVPAEAPVPVLPAESAGDGGVSGAGATVAQGTSEARTGGGRPGERQDYLALIQTWLERHKEYPRAARLRRQEGTVMLRFTIDRQGAVLAHRIERGSGRRALDAEVAEMIRRASPLPPIPAGVPGATMEIAVPIVFTLR